MMKLFRCLAFCVFAAAPLFAGIDLAPYQTYVDSVVPGSRLGISVRSLKSGKELANIRGEEKFTPASTLKTLTTATALHFLPLDYAPETIVPLLYEQLIKDIQNKKSGESISLLAKWLPSINASNADTIKKGKYLAKCFGMSEKRYRKTLADLRAYLDVVEVKMSADRFNQIDYGSVPSKAMNNYRKAFLRQDEERFNAYLAQVAKGKANINASVLYPYDIVEKYLSGGAYDEVLEAQWKALPDYVDGDKRFLVMADVSGSMYGRPMATSVSLAIYFAQRNKGPFANTFMTFSNRP